MRFKGLSNKYLCYFILIFPFAILLAQILGVYLMAPIVGVTNELGFIALNCLFIIFIGTILLFLKPSIFWQVAPLSDRPTYLNAWIVPLLVLIAAFASLYNAYEIHSEFGLPLLLIGNGEEVRLSQPLNKYVNLLQSFWFIALPLVLLVRNHLLTFILVLSVIIYSVYIGSRGAILFLIFMAGLSMRFSIPRATLIFSLAMLLILAKAIQLNISMWDYFLSLSTSQAELLNLYISADPDLYWGWFTYVRLFGPLIPGNHLSLIDLQNMLLNIQFDGLYVATAYIYPYLDFGLLGIIFFQYFNFGNISLKKIFLLSSYMYPYIICSNNKFLRCFI